MLQLAHPKVSQPNPWVFLPQVYFRWTIARLTQMQDDWGKANSKLMPPALAPEQGQLFVFASDYIGLYTKSMIQRSDYSGDLREGRSGMNRGSSPAGLCWSSAHFEQCGPDEPSGIWTQTWVQAQMLDYSLNLSTGSSAIQRWQRCQWCHSPTRRRPNQSRGSFCLKSAFARQCRLGAKSTAS